MGCDFLQGCSKYCCEPVRELINSEIMAPFIEVTVLGGGGKITVGNESHPARRNHAAVKSLKYGHTAGSGGGGLEIDIEIVDEAGGSFATFIDHIVSIQDYERIKNKNWLHAKWGWIEATCDGTTSARRFTAHTMNLINIEFTYQHGVMKYMLKGLDMSAVAFESAHDETFGTDDSPIPLKQAIEEICDRYQCSVEFRRPRTLDVWEFGDPAVKDGAGDPSWPKACWKSHGENFIQAIMRWIAPYRTNRGLGITPAFNSSLPPGSQNQLILWESFAPQCGEEKGCDRSIGTYIVNGGKHSPVISFQPNIRWTFGGLNRTSGATSSYDGGDKRETGDPNCDTGPNDPGQGNRTYNIVSDDAVNVYGTRTALKDTMDAQVEHTKANVSRNSIEAELKIQGDPLLAAPVEMVGRTCSIVVINPFHVQDIGGECGEWLQAETCNSVLSNRQWMILGTSHEVKEGSYTTTLKVTLAAAGSEISIGDPLGGDDSGHTIPR